MLKQLNIFIATCSMYFNSFIYACQTEIHILFNMAKFCLSREEMVKLMNFVYYFNQYCFISDPKYISSKALIHIQLVCDYLDDNVNYGGIYNSFKAHEFADADEMLHYYADVSIGCVEGLILDCQLDWEEQQAKEREDLLDQDKSLDEDSCWANLNAQFG